MQRSFDITSFLEAALAEDIGSGDVTGNTTIPAVAQAQFAFVAREPIVVSGMNYLAPLFSLLDPKSQLTLCAHDGDRADPGSKLAVISGNARALLAGERTALNLVQHLSGIATETRTYVDAVAGTGTKILDTRKTLPGLRSLQKYAVTCGGGTNHRMGLYDAIMIKDNHIAVAGSITAAVTMARASGFKIHVECDTLAQLDEALSVGVDSVLLDNMDIPTLTEAVARCKARGVWSEASGNVKLQTVRAIAETGVNAISIGRLTHSVRAVDIGLDA